MINAKTKWKVIVGRTSFDKLVLVNNNTSLKMYLLKNTVFMKTRGSPEVKNFSIIHVTRIPYANRYRKIA